MKKFAQTMWAVSALAMVLGGTACGEGDDAAQVVQELPRDALASGLYVDQDTKDYTFLTVDPENDLLCVATTLTGVQKGSDLQPINGGFITTIDDSLEWQVQSALSSNEVTIASTDDLDSPMVLKPSRDIVSNWLTSFDVDLGHDDITCDRALNLIEGSLFRNKMWECERGDGDTGYSCGMGLFNSSFTSEFRRSTIDINIEGSTGNLVIELESLKAADEVTAVGTVRADVTVEILGQSIDCDANSPIVATTWRNLYDVDTCADLPAGAAAITSLLDHFE